MYSKIGVLFASTPFGLVLTGNHTNKFGKPETPPFCEPRKRRVQGQAGAGRAPVVGHAAEVADDGPSRVPRKKWLWVKNRYPKWNRGKWKPGLNLRSSGGFILTQNPAHLVNSKIAGTWVFIRPKMEA